MASNGVSVNAHDHGVAVVIDGKEKNKKAKCNYCEKVVSNFHRLKYHLGGIRGDVSPCDRVPVEVREAMRNAILENKKDHLVNEVGQLSHRDLPWKRNLNTGAELSQQGASQLGGSRAAKCVRADHMSVASGHGLVSLPNWPGSVSVPNGLPSGPEDVFTRHFQKSVGKFFFETGTDFHVAKAPSFRSMMNAAHLGGLIGYQIPTPHELGSWILQDAVREMHAYVEEIKNLWPDMGCSVLLDGWKDRNNRELVSILVDCPKGVVYLGSCDISDYVGDVDALMLFVEKILEEVGEDNVVQIVANNMSGPLEMVGKQLMGMPGTLFWTVNASHCIELMLEKITKRDIIRAVLKKAKTVTKFVHGRDGVLDLLESHNCGRGLVKPSKFKCAMAFLTLETIVSKKEVLVTMFNSQDWTESMWASEREGRRVSDTVSDFSFWTGATKALKAATPLVRVLEMINEGGSDKHRLGYIYEAIDQAKLKIKEEFGNEESEYLPFWKDIDHIWNKCLHSPLHSAGYFLNPQMLYSPDYFHDNEVFGGMLCSVARMGRNKQVQDRIISQIHQYQFCLGGFSQGCTPHIISNFPPANWWSIYGGDCPDLQRLAIRILSQTCNGASRYNLKWDLAEKMLADGINRIEKQRLIDLAFVHYNSNLKNFEVGRMNSVVIDEIDPMDDWVAEQKHTH